MRGTPLYKKRMNAIFPQPNHGEEQLLESFQDLMLANPDARVGLVQHRFIGEHHDLDDIAQRLSKIVPFWQVEEESPRYLVHPPSTCQKRSISAQIVADGGLRHKRRYLVGR